LTDINNKVRDAKRDRNESRLCTVRISDK